MTPRFSISHWATWPDPLDAGTGPQALVRETEAPIPALSAMPPMQRRRVDRLGRLALHVAYASLADDAPTPLIFASRWGDIEKSIELIGQLGAGEMSPMGFSLSVHNAIAAQFSIARSDSRPYTTIAAGDGSIEAAFTEALGQLADGTEAVTVVYYDEPLPMPYRHYSDRAEFARAWACRLHLDDNGEFALTVAVPDTATVNDDIRDNVPGDVAVLHFLRSDRQQLHRQVGNTCWHWQRHV